MAPILYNAVFLGAKGVYYHAMCLKSIASLLDFLDIEQNNLYCLEEQNNKQMFEPQRTRRAHLSWCWTLHAFAKKLRVPHKLHQNTTIIEAQSLSHKLTNAETQFKCIFKCTNVYVCVCVVRFELRCNIEWKHLDALQHSNKKKNNKTR